VQFYSCKARSAGLLRMLTNHLNYSMEFVVTNQRVLVCKGTDRVFGKAPYRHLFSLLSFSFICMSFPDTILSSLRQLSTEAFDLPHEDNGARQNYRSSSRKQTHQTYKVSDHFKLSTIPFRLAHVYSLSSSQS